MTNTYLTGNALGSTSLKDLSDNASNLDEAMNSTSPSFVDRFAKRRETFAGLQAAVSNFLLNAGYQYIGEYAAGVTFSARNQYIVRAGLAYRPAASSTLPLVLTGTWATDQPKLFAFELDAVLRSDLAASSGSGLVGYRSRTVVARLDDTLNAKDYGAVGDGVADDFSAIQGLLTAAAANSRFNAVMLPAGSYRVSAGLVVPAGVTFYSEAGGEGYNGTTVSGGAEILADLAVPTIVTLNGGSASAACNMRRILVRRAAGSIPAGSIGVRILSTDDCILEDVVSTRSAIGISVEGQLGITLQNCNTFAVTDTHLQLKNVVEVTCIGTRFGRNGGADLAATSYVRLTGAVDTVSFVRCQMNQSGPFVAGPVLDFASYNSPNGIVTIDDCHMESFNGPLLLQEGPGSSTLQRLTVANSQIHSDAATRELLAGLTAFVDQLNLIGNPSIIGKITLDQQTKWSVIGNFIQGDVVINAGSGVCTGNRLFSNLQLVGAFPDGLDHCAVVSGNALIGGGVFTNTATGNISAFGNVQGSASTNALIVNTLGGGFLKMADVGFAVKRLSGSLATGGTATIPFSLGNLTVLSVSAFYRDTGGSARPLTVTYVDGSNIVVSGGTVGAHYRLAVVYSNDIDSTW